MTTAPPLPGHHPETTAAVPDGSGSPGRSGHREVPRLWAHALVGLMASTAIVAGAIVGGSRFVSTTPGSWFFGTPGGPLGALAGSGTQPPAVADVFVYGGLLLLAAAWWRLVRDLDHSRGVAVAKVVLVLAVWAIPFLVGPPVFSRDVFSYAGQGEMVSHHINPYLYGPGVLGGTRFTDLTGQLWSNTPSPYGPLFLALDGLATTVAQHQVLADLVLLRLLAVAGVALMVAGLPTLARALGRDPAPVVAFAVGSPLVLVTLVGGGHNDALMVGLLVAGLAAARRWGPVPGIVLCALAVAVKAPALLGVGFIGWNWAGAAAPVWRRVGRTALATAIAGATLSVVSAVTGIGWGWLGTVAAEDKIHTGVTPVDALAQGVAGLMHLFGSGVSTTSVRAVLAVVGLAVATGATAWYLWHSPRQGLERSLGMSLLLFALLAPVLWGWYLTWGLVVLAPVAAGNLRRALAGLTTVEVLFGATAVIGIVRAVLEDSLGVEVAIVVVLGALALACGRWSWSRDPRYPDRRSPWWGQRALQPVGVTVTANQRPQSRQ